MIIKVQPEAPSGSVCVGHRIKKPNMFYVSVVTEVEKVSLSISNLRLQEVKTQYGDNRMESFGLSLNNETML
jgi:hypothetical protein